MVKLNCNRVKRRLNASTILEVVISMVIIVFVIGIALMILSNVMRLSLSAKQIKANALLQQELINTNTSGLITNETLQSQDWKIEKKFKPYALGSSLTEADFTVLDLNGEQIAELKSVIINATK